MAIRVLQPTNLAVTPQLLAMGICPKRLQEVVVATRAPCSKGCMLALLVSNIRLSGGDAHG